MNQYPAGRFVIIDHQIKDVTTGWASGWHAGNGTLPFTCLGECPVSRPEIILPANLDNSPQTSVSQDPASSPPAVV